MKEHFQWGDTDGNNGYWYDNFSEAELQALWELQGMPYWNAFCAVPQTSPLQIFLDYEGDPVTPIIPLKKDALAVKAAIRAKAKQISREGDIHPPTITDIRDQIRSRLHLPLK